MAGQHESQANLYQVLLDRCRYLEASQAKLREQVGELVQEIKNREEEETAAEADSDDGASEPGWEFSRGFYFAGSPYRSMLESVGHAVHVCTPSSGRILYWNRSAENLYGWKAEEVLGHAMVELLVAKEYHTPLKKIMEMLSSGESWSGQFPFKNRSGESFIAIMTKSPLYEDGELAGVITVSCDAAVFNRMDPQNLIKSQERGRGQGSNLRNIRWHPPRSQITAVPQIASSVSNLASKLLPWRNGNNISNSNTSSIDGYDNVTEVEDSKLEKPGSLAAKFLAKLHSIGTSNRENEDDRIILQNGASNTPIDKDVRSECISPRGPKASPAVTYRIDSDNREENGANENSIFSQRYSPDGPHSHVVSNALEAELVNSDTKLEDELQKRPNARQFPCSGGSSVSQESSSGRGDSELGTESCLEIRWEDLQLGEEVGKGSFAVVHRGIWNGSDVAVKVYFSSDYNEGTLLDCKKEIDIMKKLRHPNVLLFMGAVYSQVRLAIVTEYLPRGSLFKILHKNNQILDIRRRLRMALDVARGMNYLHHRNPPIVHRDLKSSNLLVDKNWNVKVGDFGLSRWKHATFLSTKSGRGTPQWMAPEVLRNEPSNEKSDVFGFGVILWELMTVSVPWNNLNALQVVGVVGFMDRRLDLPEGLDPRIASLISDCWQSDPGKRPSCEEIIQRMTSLCHKGSAG